MRPHLGHCAAAQKWRAPRTVRIEIRILRGNLEGDRPRRIAETVGVTTVAAMTISAFSQLEVPLRHGPLAETISGHRGASLDQAMIGWQRQRSL
jgi:hypothetical protein